MRWIVAVLLLVPSMAFAQAPITAPPVDPHLNFCQKAVTALQSQRNGAEDQAAQCSAQLTILDEELKKANAELTDLKKKPDDTKK